MNSPIGLSGLNELESRSKSRSRQISAKVYYFELYVYANKRNKCRSDLIGLCLDFYNLLNNLLSLNFTYFIDFFSYYLRIVRISFGNENIF